MKIIFTLIIISAFSVAARPAYSTSSTNHGVNIKINNGDKKEKITIGSNRESGDMELRFATDKKGEATITVLNESGKIMLQQANEVKNGVNTIPLKNATGLTGGSYTVCLISNKETYTTRFLVWK